MTPAPAIQHRVLGALLTAVAALPLAYLVMGAHAGFGPLVQTILAPAGYLVSLLAVLALLVGTPVDRLGGAASTLRVVLVVATLPFTALLSGYTLFSAAERAGLAVTLLVILWAGLLAVNMVFETPATRLVRTTRPGLAWLIIVVAAALSGAMVALFMTSLAGLPG